MLQIGTRTYTNVTVTTKAKGYIFILHAGGMASIKVAELPLDLQVQFGYASAPAPKFGTNSAAGWVKKEMAKLDVGQVTNLSKQFQQWQAHPPPHLAGLVGPSGKPNYALLAGVLLGYLLMYLFASYCAMLICRKAGHPPGILIWLPCLKVFPLFRAAGMSYWWILALFVPLLNLVPVLLWPLKIAKARGKSVWVGILLFVPVANLFAFLYLAFSDGGPADEEEEPKIMSLQAA